MARYRQRLEHRQHGKNNHYDAASRVALLFRGPSVAPAQQLATLASLNDVYPTVLDAAGVDFDSAGLAGSSLLALVDLKHFKLKI